MNPEEVKTHLRLYLAKLKPDSYAALAINHYLEPGATRVDPREAATEVYKEIRQLNELLEDIAADRQHKDWHLATRLQLEALRALRKHYIEQYYGLSLF